MKSGSLLVAVALASFPITGLAAGANDDIDYNRDIRPILAENCYACHGPDGKKREAGLRLDVEAIATSELESGEIAVVPGNPKASALVARILATDPDERMPPAETKKTLTAEQKQLLQRWISAGAKWQAHWAYVPPQRAPAPKLDQAGFVRNDIDPFILAMLNAKKLAPSAEADRVTLIRRLNFDLTGLPPTPAEVAAFVKDSSPDAYEQLVERLLQSPHYGERMAIYWLDVVRYADSNGYHSDEPREIAPYRDYVIDAFNKNKPYDRFVIEQLAGDLMPDKSHEEMIASGFNMLLQTTNEGGAQPKEYLAKYSADRVRNTSSIFLGATMGCCECHDHKFDPFTTKDFYSFAAFFADIQEKGMGNPPTYPVMTGIYRDQVDKLDQQIAMLQQQLTADDPELAAEQQKWEASFASQVSGTPTFTPWHVIGPFAADSFDKAHDTPFPPEKEIDLAKTYDGLAWRQADEFVDGKIHALTGANAATYLVRKVQAPGAMPLNLSLGSDDGIKVWLNGALVHENKISRGVAPDQDKPTLSLRAGENQLLIKITNGGGESGFYFQPLQAGLPDNIAAVIKTPADQRNDQQRRELTEYYRNLSPRLEGIRKQIKDLTDQKTAVQNSLPRTLMTVSGNPRTIRILARGNWMDESGAETLPAIPEFLGTLDTKDRRATRLDLAHWIVDRNNPLTARAFVNRLWKQYFGHGLATPLDDLGQQGSLPTHPQLLDWLAVEFMDSGWDIKHMVRLMVGSGTYRQTSVAAAALRELDPNNVWYARQSRFRLDAELVRDNALAVSGLLSRQVGGRSVKPYQPAGYWRHMNFPVRTWQPDAGENLYRRGLYTWWQRMFLHPSLLAFDAPSREECTVERPRSNTPLQALVLLNDPTFVEAARAFAERIVSEGGTDVAARMDWAYREALSRGATPQELDVLQALYDKHLQSYQQDDAAARQLLGVGAKPVPAGLNTAELAAWTSVARTIFNLHEMITRP